MAKHRFRGLDRDVFLPDDIEVEIDIVPDDKIGWVRSGVHETGQTKTTFHDTGTPGSTARGQRNYLHGGPQFRDDEGVLRRRKVGFNFAVDDKRIIQLTPLDEQTWAAGSGNGNKVSWHIEQCFGGDIDWERSLRNAIALHAGLIAAKNWSTDSALVQHHHWTLKNCPGQIRRKELWNSVLRQVGENARAAGGGGGQVTFVDPQPIPELEPFSNGDLNTTPAMVKAADGTSFFFVADRVKATHVTPRLQLANSNADRVGPDLKVNEEFDVMWIFESSADQDLYYVSPFNTRIRVADTERVGDRPGPAPDPMEDDDGVVAVAGERGQAGPDEEAPGH